MPPQSKICKRFIHRTLDRLCANRSREAVLKGEMNKCTEKKIQMEFLLSVFSF